MAERIHNLKQTSANFQVSGIITGTKSQKFYKSGDKWNTVEFGVKINEQKTVYCKLTGYTRDYVYYYKKSEIKGEKGTSKRVDWKDRKKSPGDGFNLIGTRITTGKDENGKNVNEVMVEWDAVEYIHDNWTDGMSVFINGNMEFSSYESKDGTKHRKTTLVPTQIYLSSDIDFSAEGYKENAEFDNTLVFSDIEPEEDENGKRTGRYVLSGYSVGYNNIENVVFIIDADHSGVAKAIKKKMRSGNAIKTYGRISIVHNVEEVEVSDDWGSTEVSPMENKKVAGSSKTEYIVYKVDGDTFDTETYDEDAIAAAIRAVKNEKEAKKNFGDKPTSKVVNVSADDWDDEDNLDDEEPWD